MTLQAFELRADPKHPQTFYSFDLVCFPSRRYFGLGNGPITATWKFRNMCHTCLWMVIWLSNAPDGDGKLLFFQGSCTEGPLKDVLWPQVAIPDGCQSIAAKVEGRDIDSPSRVAWGKRTKQKLHEGAWKTRITRSLATGCYRAGKSRIVPYCTISYHKV